MTTQVIEKISIRFGLIISLGTIGTMFGFPEWWQRIETERAIDKRVDKIALEFPEKISKKYAKDSIEFHKQLKIMRGSIKWLKDENTQLKIDLKELIKHADFNTTALSITSSALLEEMDKKQNPCGWDYYETNGGDNWAMFNCSYNSQILYSVDLRSDCRAYYTPINGAKTQVKF